MSSWKRAAIAVVFIVLAGCSDDALIREVQFSEILGREHADVSHLLPTTRVEVTKLLFKLGYEPDAEAAECLRMPAPCRNGDRLLSVPAQLFDLPQPANAKERDVFSKSVEIGDGTQFYGLLIDWDAEDRVITAQAYSTVYLIF
ncbi:MAG: hypothetical protein EON61_00815 [Alphaproteobacteria bacterium]|nr:MAG: hypothetical protein EON61_00815 [Alphaproteobacteria bacterium]